MALVPLGQSCAPTGGSTRSHWCVDGATRDNTNVCVTYVPSTLQGSGQVCNSTGLESGNGLQCVNATCVPLVTASNSCDSVRRCQSDLLCNAANVCIARGAAGAVCASNAECRAEVFWQQAAGPTKRSLRRAEDD